MRRRPDHRREIATAERRAELGRHAQNVTLLEYMVEVEYQGARIERLEEAVDDAIGSAPKEMKAVIDALQSLRGVAKITAVTLAVELASFQRFERASSGRSVARQKPRSAKDAQRARSSAARPPRTSQGGKAAFLNVGARAVRA